MKNFILLISVSIFSIAATAQVRTVGKTDVARVESRVVEKTAVAVPFDQAGSVEIDSSNYHKAVGGIGPADQTISLTATAVRAEDGTQHVKKEAITVKQPGAQGIAGSEQKMVEIKAAASKR